MKSSSRCSEPALILGKQAELLLRVDNPMNKRLIGRNSAAISERIKANAFGSKLFEKTHATPEVGVMPVILMFFKCAL